MPSYSATGLSIFCPPCELSATVQQGLSKKERTVVFCTEASESDVSSTLSISPSLAMISKVAISDTSDTRKRTARDSLFQALHYDVSSRGTAPSHPETLATNSKSSSWPRMDFLRKTTDDTYDLSCGRHTHFSSVSFICTVLLYKTFVTTPYHITHKIVIVSLTSSSALSLRNKSCSFASIEIQPKTAQFLGLRLALERISVDVMLLAFARLDS